MHPYRTHTCAQLSSGNVGETVRLSGWIHRKRDHGGVLFVDLRDHYGITQIVADSDSPALPVLEGLRVEDPNATEAIVAVRRGVLDARGLALSEVPGIGILLEDAGGRLTDVGMSGAARAVVQRSCSGAAPALEVTGLTCDGCASAAVERCEDGP